MDVNISKLITLAALDEDCINYNDILLQIESDEDDLAAIELLCSETKSKRLCIRNYAEEVVPSYTEKEFRTHFRIKRELFLDLTKRFSADSSYENMRKDKKLSAEKHLLIFLWFAGHESSSFRDIGDRFDVCTFSVGRIIRRVAMFLSGLAKEVIRWPNDEKKKKTAGFFEDKYCFPKVIGAIDRMLVPIDPPSDKKNDYIDCEGNTSISLQAICNEAKKFIGVFVGYPGSVPDSRVFQSSFIYEKLPNACGEYYLLGDSAYPLSEYLLTPYRDNGHLTAANKHYNYTLSACRVVIENAFDILKQRFPKLNYCKLKGGAIQCHFIMACCVLHNLADECDLEFTTMLNIQKDDASGAKTSQKAKLLRDSVCSQLFLNKNNPSL